MTPTNDQIVAEAVRRREAVPIEQRFPVEDYVIEVMRENWTPPEPVDPDRELAKTIARGMHSELDDFRAVEATAASVLAGIKAAREREQERAKVLVEFAKGRVPLTDAADVALAKYWGEA